MVKVSWLVSALASGRPLDREEVLREWKRGHAANGTRYYPRSEPTPQRTSRWRNLGGSGRRRPRLSRYRRCLSATWWTDVWRFVTPPALERYGADRSSQNCRQIFDPGY